MASKKAVRAPARATPAKAKKSVKSAPKRAEKAARASLDELATRLTEAVPEPRCELAFHDGFELLVATILSAQSTDKAVNAVTPELFKRWPDARALADAAQEDVEVVVKRTGFFRNKAKSIRSTAQKLVSEFDGRVPRTLDELVTLPGVARKTANVVLGTAYGIASGFVVDTHIARVAQRLHLTEASEPGKIEQDLCALFPEREWVDMGHRILLHGRYTCLAKKPMCTACPLNELCPSRESAPEGSREERARSEASRVQQGMAAV
jgi:endonuclease-3